jgi:Rrf2 family protein
MPPRYLEQMMQKLVRAGVLRGVRGPSGGYLLAREKRRITLADISKAVGEEETIPASTPLGNKIVVPTLSKCHEALFKQLGETTIADLCEQASIQNIRKTADEFNNFNI